MFKRALAGAAAIATFLTFAASDAAAQQPPTFKARVELVTVDATVLDKDGRPVQGLGPDDFRLTIEGEPRRIVSAQFISYPGAESAADRAAAGGAATQTLEGRVLLIAVDQANIRRVEGGAALQAAATFVDALSPADRIAAAAVEGAEPIEFTADHARVKRTLTTLLGRAVSMPTEFPLGIAEALGIADGSRGWLDRVVTRVCGQPLARVQRMERMAAEEGMRDPCPTHVEQQARARAHSVRMQGQQSVEAIKRLLRRLDDVEGPKTLVLLAEGLIAEPRLVDMTDVALLAQQARTTIYVLQVDAPVFEAGDEMLAPSTAEDVRARGDGLARLASATGGTLLQLVGTDPYPFRRVLRESSAHYLLAFEPTAKDRARGWHRISVNVVRPSLAVRARPVFSLPPAAPVPLTVEGRLVQLLRSRHPSAGLPVTLGITRTRAADASKVDAHITIEADAARTDLTYGAVVVDTKGIVVTSATSRSTSGRFSFAAAVPSGRYLFRAAVVDPEGRAGTVERTFDVQLTGQPLTSDLALTAAIGGETVPIVERTATKGISAAFEIYADKGWTPPASLTVEVGSGSGVRRVYPADVRWVEEDACWTAVATLDLTDLPRGRYAVTAQLPGAAPLTRSVVLTR